MITLKQFFETTDYRITEGSDYGWDCYGSNAHMLSAWNGIVDAGGWSATTIFDTKTQMVYEVEVCDYTNHRAYRIINPAFVAAHKEEAKDRVADINQAWDDVVYTDLEVDNDWLEKATAIVGGKDYDTRVQIPLTLEDDHMFDLMRLAHEQDITLNQLVEKLLRQHMDLVESS